MLTTLSANPGALELLLHAARFTTKYVRLVGQEPAPSKCVFLSISRRGSKGYEGVGFFLKEV